MLDLDKFDNFTPGPWIGCTRTLPKKGEIHEIRQNKAGSWKVGAVEFVRDLELVAAAPDLLALAKEQRDRIAKLEAVIRLTDKALKECGPVKRREIDMRDVQEAIASVMEPAHA